MLYKAFTVGLLGLTACPPHRPAPQQLPVESVRRDDRPKKPVEAMFGRPDDNGRWLRLREVRFEEGKTFGWRIRLPCRQAVEFTEVMRLPAPGDFEALADVRETVISNQNTIATTRDFAACIDGWIEHSWALGANDPKGPWEITVTIAGYEPQQFRATFVD